MAEYRPVPDERDDEFWEFTRYAFSPTAGPFDPDEATDDRIERMHSFGDERGMFDGEDLLVVCKHLDFTARVRDEWLPMAGLSAVASPPEHRRRGLVGELLEASLAEYRKRGQLISALYPFDERFYARYGWATGCRHHRVTVEPEALVVTADPARGSFRRLGPDDHGVLEPVYEAWLDGVTLATRRSADWWRDRVFQSHGGELYAAVWQCDGLARGYVVYDVEDGDDRPGARRLKTYELAFADHEAYVNLLRYCYNHDSQVDVIELHGRNHGRILDVVADRDAVELTVANGPMVRIVDLRRALEAIPYHGVERADLDLAVVDEHAPWNDGTFSLRVRDGRATVGSDDQATIGSTDQEATGSDDQAAIGSEDQEATGSDAEVTPESDPEAKLAESDAEVPPESDQVSDREVDAGPEATVDVGTLSQLFVGHLPVKRARKLGGLRVETPAAAATLDALFPERDAHLPERF
jgi:predicted acetyltransferase